MRFIENLCPPALLYLLFLVVQLGLDGSLGLYVTLVIKAILGIAVVILLDTLCGVNLSAVSWFIVAVPFVVTALATAISMGTGFDAKIMNGLVVEKFRDKIAKTDDIPADSNSITSSE